MCSVVIYLQVSAKKKKFVAFIGSHANHLRPINFGWVNTSAQICLYEVKKKSLFTRIHWPTNQLFIQINATIKHLQQHMYISSVRARRWFASLFAVLQMFVNFIILSSLFSFSTSQYCILMGFSSNMNSSLRKVCDCTLGFFFFFRFQ